MLRQAFPRLFEYCYPFIKYHKYFISAIFYGIFNYFGLDVVVASDYNYDLTYVFYLILPVMSIISIVIAVMNDVHVSN